MPLHDWTDRDNFDGLHLLWVAELVGHLRHTLPHPYRVVVGSSPVLSFGGEAMHPDVAVSNGRNGDTPAVDPWREPDFEAAVAVEEEDATVQVERDGRLVAAIELISPRNKDRPSARDRYTARYLGYLHHGVHLLVVDVHRRPIGFSFPQRIAAELAAPLPAPPAPSAVAYRVGEPMPEGGRLLAVWAEPLTIGQPLPAMSLPLTVHLAVPVDLEGTYTAAAENCYL